MNNNENQLIKALEWLATGDTGISSKSMLFIHLGIHGDFYRYPPSDPSDFNRCLMLVDQVPEVAGSFGKIREISEEWALIIDNWNEIEECFHEEAGVNWCKGRLARKTYEMMKSLSKQLE